LSCHGDAVLSLHSADSSFYRSNYFYDTGMYFPKATILALYFELFPTTMPNLRICLYLVTAFTVASGFTTAGLDTFYCHHIPDNWSTEEGACSTFNSLLVLQIDWAMNFSSDLFSTCCFGPLHFQNPADKLSLRIAVPIAPRPHTQTRTTIRPNPHLRARPPNPRRQPRTLRHNPTWHRLERRLRLVDGRNERSNHGRLPTGTKILAQILEKRINIPLGYWTR
jgi:hypothetical protein